MSTVYCATCDDLHERTDTCEAYDQNVNRQMRAIRMTPAQLMNAGSFRPETSTEGVTHV